ncbi:hypothetical protein ABT330_06585 [Streptomyces sp. NPDC000658]|uniref:hypothetical protein n=1 Tax=Streptomyces sp. NPDC000658 TaxID=3154266 RepID=UPI00331BEAC6
MIGGPFTSGAYRLDGLFQAGEFPRSGKDLGGVDSLPAPFFEQARLTHPVQGQAQQVIGAVVLAQPVTEVRHTGLRAPEAILGG